MKMSHKSQIKGLIGKIKIDKTRLNLREYSSTKLKRNLLMIPSIQRIG